jgi:SAM-dependent methyltransferase
MFSEIKSAIRPLYKWIFPDIAYYVPRELEGCDSILDLGSGKNSVIQLCPATRKVGVELFEPYIKESREKGIHDEYIKEDVMKVDFPPKSFDAVIMVDVLEHLTAEEGSELIKKMETWARKKIVIFTPNGFVHQHEFDENHLQEHKSGWTAGDLKGLGFTVHGGSGWKALRGDMALMKYQPAPLWFFISELTQKFVYCYPEMAYHLFAVKNV